VVPSLEIFGQHELAELAQDKKLMAEMVGRIAGQPVAADSRPAIVRDLAENRGDLARIEQSQQDLEDELADIPRLTEQAQKFTASDLGEKLAAKRRLNADEAALDEILRRLDLVSTQTAELHADTLLASVRAEVAEFEDSPRRALLESARSALTTTADTVEASLRAIQEAVKTAMTTVQQTRADWTAAVQEEVQANDKVFRQLIADGYDPDSYITTTTQLTKLTTRARQRTVFAIRRDTLLEKRDLLMAKLAENESAITQELHDAVRTANAATSSAVVVRPVPNPDRAAIKTVINAHIRGQRGQIMSAVDASDFSIPTFVAAARTGDAALASYQLTGAQLKNVLDAGEPLFREL
jgi:hypothetical protein